MLTARRGRDLAGRARRRDDIRRRRAPRPVASTRGCRSSHAEIVAHELRTPLTSLLVGGAMLVRRDLRDDMRQQVALDVVAEGARLAAVVEDLLALLGDESRPEPAEPLNLPHLLRTAVARAGITAPGVTVRLHGAPDAPVVLGPATQVQHLVLDLLVLAHAAAEPDGRVDVVASDRQGRAVLHVTGTRAAGTPTPSRHPVLAEAAARTLAARMGADLWTIATERRFSATLVLPGSATPETLDA